MRELKLFWIMGLFLTSTAMGNLPKFPVTKGNDIGNGGDVIVCPNELILLDYFEASQPMGLTMDLGDGLTEDDHVLYVLEKMKQRSPLVAERLQGYFTDFYQEASFVPNVELTDIPDSNHIVLPAGCNLKQAAVQNKTVLPFQKRYIFDKNLWDQMVPVQRAGLILHELVYRMFLEFDHKNSITTRYWNALIMSTAFRTMKDTDFEYIAKAAGFMKIDLRPGIPMPLYRFKSTGECKVEYSEGNPRREFYSNGSVKNSEVMPCEPLKFASGDIVNISSTTRDLIFEFYENGAQQYLYSGSDAYFVFEPQSTYTVQNRQIKVKSYLKFYETGDLKATRLNENWVYLKDTSEIERCYMRNDIVFNEHGLVVSGQFCPSN